MLFFLFILVGVIFCCIMEDKACKKALENNKKQGGN